MPFPVHKKLFICERHFEKKYISKKKLLDGAFPKLKLNVNSFSSSSNSGSSELILQPVQRTYIRPNLDEDLTLEEFERFSILEENRQRFDIRGSDDLVYDQEHFAQVARSFQSNANKQDKEIMQLKQEVEILKKQYLDLEKRAIVASKNASEDAINFARMIVSKINTYTEEEKNLAQNLNYISTKAYSFMRDDLKFALPHKKSLMRWRPIRYVRAGIDAKVLENLKKIVNEMSERQKICEIIFDEISVKSDLVYKKSRDVIDGFADSGGNNRKMFIADKCCFFMVKAIAGDWKYVLSYYLAKEAYLKHN